MKLSNTNFLHFFLNNSAREISIVRRIIIVRFREIACEKISNRVPCQKLLMKVRSWKSMNVNTNKRSGDILLLRNYNNFYCFYLVNKYVETKLKKNKTK